MSIDRVLQVPGVDDRADHLNTPAGRQLANAVNLAGWGFKIGPLKGKVPLTSRGFYDFTTDYDTIVGWWRQHPEANIGARPWPWSVVLDVDVRSGGLETWQLLNNGHPLPTTLVTETGSGGFHYWFKKPYQGKVKGSAGQGIDIKHHGGYLVMPGSYNTKTGKHYTCPSWVPPLDLPDLPEHLRRHVYRPPAVIRPALPQPLRRVERGGGLIGSVADAPEGNRNNVLYWACCVAQRDGLDITAELADAAIGNGIPETEVHATIRSAHTATDKKESRKWSSLT